MRVLITFDSNGCQTDRAAAQREIRRICERYGKRVQPSVFELDLDCEVWPSVKSELEQWIDPRKESLRYYRLNWVDAADPGLLLLEHFGTKVLPKDPYDQRLSSLKLPGPLTKISDEVLSRASAKGGVQIGRQQRGQIRRLIEEYEIDEKEWQAALSERIADRKKLRSHSKKAEALAHFIKSDKWAQYHLRWRGMDPKLEIAQLVALSDGLGWAAGPSGRGKKRHEAFRYLLERLAGIFREVGGGSTRISRDSISDVRKSKFVDFVWTIINELPATIKPASGQALASAWEKFGALTAKKDPPRRAQ
jgi:CRISPR-associated protein Cas2